MLASLAAHFPVPRSQALCIFLGLGRNSETLRHNFPNSVQRHTFSCQHQHHPGRQVPRKLEQLYPLALPASSSKLWGPAAMARHPLSPQDRPNQPEKTITFKKRRTLGLGKYLTSPCPLEVSATPDSLLIISRAPGPAHVTWGWAWWRRQGPIRLPASAGWSLLWFSVGTSRPLWVADPVLHAVSLPPIPGTGS